MFDLQGIHVIVEINWWDHHSAENSDTYIKFVYY